MWIPSQYWRRIEHCMTTHGRDPLALGYNQEGYAYGVVTHVKREIDPENPVVASRPGHDPLALGYNQEGYAYGVVTYVRREVDPESPEEDKKWLCLDMDWGKDPRNLPWHTREKQWYILVWRITAK
eukprot:gene29658-16901_t